MGAEGQLQPGGDAVFLSDANGLWRVGADGETTRTLELVRDDGAWLGVAPDGATALHIHNEGVDVTRLSDGSSRNIASDAWAPLGGCGWHVVSVRWHPTTALAVVGMLYTPDSCLEPGPETGGEAAPGSNRATALIDLEAGTVATFPELFGALSESGETLAYVDQRDAPTCLRLMLRDVRTGSERLLDECATTSAVFVTQAAR